MNFDEIIPRAGTGSLKYDFGPERLGREDLLPMWVADMDFAVPDCVREALLRTVDHRIYGYTETKADYARSVTGWFERRSGYTFPAESLVKTPGVVFAIGMAIQAFTERGECFCVIDNVPAQVVADAGIVNRVADCTIYVVRSGKLDRRYLPELERLYQEKKFNNLCVLINDSKIEKRRYGYGYGYGYGRYGYGYGNEKKGKKSKA